jgi:phenylalanyl-tRNA synthetase beta chain
LALANPISADLAAMRTSLWPGLLNALRYNQNRQEERIRLFEFGLRFLPQDRGLAQDPMLAGIASGPAYPEQWGLATRPVDFFDVKRDVEALLALTGCAAQFRFSRSEHPALHPGQSAAMSRDGEVIGQLGLLHPALQRELDITGAVVLFELQFLALTAGRVPAFRELSRFPAVRRDLAIVVAEAVSVDAIRGCLAEASGELLEDVRLFDVYRGKGIDRGRKSVALGLTLREPSRTLTDGEVNGVMERMLSRLQADLGATLRE